MTSPIRLLLVDDDDDIRCSIRAIVEATGDMVVVGEASDGRRGVAEAQRLRPDVVILDVNMPQLGGVEAAAEIVRASSARVLMLTSFGASEVTRAALAAGASGYLLKAMRPDEFQAAVRAVASGQGFLAPAVASGVIQDAVSARRRDERDATLLAPLTDRERELVSAIGRGLTNAEIAVELVLSPASIKTYVSRVLVKLELENRTQLAILAHRSGLLD